MSNVLGDVKSLEAQEYISKTTQGVNQSTSLIALENDRQKADLERYSAQSGKYDTTYENFDNTSSPDRTFSRSELLFNDSVSLRG